MCMLSSMWCLAFSFPPHLTFKAQVSILKIKNHYTDHVECIKSTPLNFDIIKENICDCHI